LQDASERAEVGVYFSIPTLDERVWRTTEPGTAPPRSRLEAVRRLSGAGIDVGVGMAPILPGLSDRPEQLEEVVRAARTAGARSIWVSALHLRPGTREHFLEALAQDWPEEVARYEQLFAGRAYLPATFSRPLQEHVRATARATPMRHVPSPTRRKALDLPQLKLAV
jgi:DNA repair photolyase